MMHCQNLTENPVTSEMSHFQRTLASCLQNLPLVISSHQTCVPGFWQYASAIMMPTTGRRVSFVTPVTDS
jgi:hypothetical protein